LKIVGNGGPVNLDLNHDGIPDFALTNTSKASAKSSVGYLRVAPNPKRIPNAVWAITTENGSFSHLCAAALRAGTRIGRERPFQKKRLVMAGFFSEHSHSVFSFYGPWRYATNRYLGLKFSIKGKIHFGWARLTVSASRPGFTATLTGYAYETVPSEAIVAGKTKGPDDTGVEESASLTTPTREPVTLGLLSLGSSGLSIWRREESAATPARN
jgi:hypothetical protein